MEHLCEQTKKSRRLVSQLFEYNNDSKEFDDMSKSVLKEIKKGVERVRGDDVVMMTNTINRYRDSHIIQAEKEKTEFLATLSEEDKRDFLRELLKADIKSKRRHRK